MTTRARHTGDGGGGEGATSPGHLGRLTLLLGAVIALDSTMYSSVTPLLPELRSSAELSGAVTGLVVGGYSLGLLAFAIPSGWIAGRTGARTSVVAGSVLLAVASLAFGVADAAWVLVLARFLQGVAAALQWAGALTWLIGASGPGKHGVTIGTVVASAVVGSIVGPLLGVVGAATGRVPVFVAISVVAVFLGALLHGLDEPQGSGDITTRAVVRAVRHPWFATLMWVVTLCAGAFGALAVIAPLRLDGYGATAAMIGGVFFTGAVLEMATGPIVGSISDVRGRRLPLAAATVAACALLVAWYLAQDLWSSLALLALALPALGMMLTPALAGMTDVGSSLGLSIAGIAGLTNFIWALGEAIGALGAGVLVGAGQAALGSAVIAALLLATLPLLTVGDGTAATSEPRAPGGV